MRVLLATDGSKHASEAAEWLARFPLASTTSVLVLAVAPLPVLSTGIPSTRDLEEMIDRRHDRRRRQRRARAEAHPTLELAISSDRRWRTC
jgi:nucleotide-binding universal stress UspA family protein